MANDPSDHKPPSRDPGQDNPLHGAGRFSPERIGRSAAMVHGHAEWQNTSDYRTERRAILEHAFHRLHELLPHYPEDRSIHLLHRQLEEADAALANGLPDELPFLSSSRHVRLRLRIVTVTREWLLTSRSHPNLEDLMIFLTAYQAHSPLHDSEIRLIPTALRLTLAERCHILPCPGKTSHMDIIPRLLEELARTCTMIVDTDWDRFAEEISQVDSLLERLHLGSIAK